MSKPLTQCHTYSQQILNGPEAAMPRCGSLDSLRDGPHVPHDDGKLAPGGGGGGGSASGTVL